MSRQPLYKNQPTKILGYNLSSISNSIIGGFILSQWNRQTYKSINSLGVAAKIHIISTNKQSSQFKASPNDFPPA